MDLKLTFCALMNLMSNMKTMVLKEIKISNSEPLDIDLSLRKKHDTTISAFFFF